MRRLVEQERPRIFCTPPESLVRSLACALSLIYEEGLSNVYARHKTMARAFLAFVEGWGGHLLAQDPKARSHTVSAMEVPEGIDARALLDNMLQVDRVAMAPGQEHLKGKIIRLGHMGPVTPAQLMRGLESLARALAELGTDKERTRAGLEAAAQVLA